MTFYDLTSTVLTVIGYTILVYRIVFELESDNRLDDKSQGKSKSRQ